MPTYVYECKACTHGFEKILPVKEYDTPQVCPECQSPEVVRVVSCTNFTLVGDGWPGKAIRVNSQMKKKHENMAPRVAEKKREEPLTRLVPNVEGEVTGSWADAQKLAKSEGKASDSYEPLVHKERHGDI